MLLVLPSLGRGAQGAPLHVTYRHVCAKASPMTAVLGISANYESYLETAPKQSTEETCYVYNGFTPVSLSKE